MSFTDYEMISHPTLILTVISSSDIDHVSCLQELCSPHYLPPGMSNGLYDPNIQRIYLLLHDNCEHISLDPNAILSKLYTRFPAANTRLLAINSLPPDSPNVQQPDIWTSYILPTCFPHDMQVDEARANLPKNPLNGNPALGCRLSMEDFMALRDFCMKLFNRDIIPVIERKTNFLGKQVSENRKGVKNVLKSFWRKAKDETDLRGTVKYR